MDYQKFEQYISKPRLDRYLNACSGCPVRAQELYQANLKIAESFYSVLNLFEVFLRNRINIQLSSHFKNPDWIINEKNGFMNNPILAPSKFFLLNQVLTAEKRALIKNGAVTSGIIIAEQNLGFWTSLFDTHHYKLLSGSIIHCFPNKPSNIQRKQINQTLHEIREFRNRIYHNEPICFNGSNIDFGLANKIKSDIYNILNWIDNDLANYTAKFDNINANITLAQKI